MQLHAYLFFDGNCADAIVFYSAALGARQEMKMRYGEMPDAEKLPAEMASRIAHARLKIGESILMLADDAPGHITTPVKRCTISITALDLATAEAQFNRLAEGGEITMPFAATFWAKGFGMLVDRFGVSWMVNVEKESDK